jgi:hypothetical protein
MYFLHALLKNAYMPIFIYLFILSKNQGWIKTEEGKWWKETRDIEQNPRQLHIVRSMQIRVRYNIKQVHGGYFLNIVPLSIAENVRYFMQTTA